MPTTSNIIVTKRNGSKEPLDLDKIHKVLFWACEDITGVSVSKIELSAKLQFTTGIKTSEIHNTLIRSAADLISENTPNYQYVAARLVNYQLRKELYGEHEPWPIRKIVERNVTLGVYDKSLLTFTDEEFEEFENIIKHNRDFSLVYAAVEQFRGKYLVKNRVNETFHETPQVAYLMIAATMFINEPIDRMVWIKEYYDAISLHDISLPTPVMAGVRTPTRQFASCVLIATGDTMMSIEATTSAIYRYISRRAGLGIDVGPIRSVGSGIRGGETESTGLQPFLRSFQGAVKSCSQGGIRGGSATITYPFWHAEFESLVMLKSSKGIEKDRIRMLDYCVQANRLLYTRLIKGGDISFFSPSEAPGLIEAFHAGDNDLFESLYAKYENDPSIRSYSISAIEFFTTLMTQRKETGRIYIQNIDHCNSHGSYIPEVAPIRQTNLCVEITQPTRPMQGIEDPDGLIALCTLSAHNLGKIKSTDQFERIARLTVRALDNLLDYQDYPVLAAKKHTMDYRPLGIGMINLAYFLAKNDCRYDDNALELVQEYAEAWSFHLIKASMELAIERGPCLMVEHTKYAQGILPIDTYKKSVDQLVPHQERVDWEWLRGMLKEHGIRNATVMALMPSETSAQIANATNGIEPPRALVSEKVSKHGVFKQVVPEIGKLKNKYDLLWDQVSPKGYLHITAVLQKYIDQAISVNVSYNPELRENGSLSMTEMIGDILEHYKYGGKTLYYQNTYDAAEEENKADAQEVIEDEEECESCIL